MRRWFAIALVAALGCDDSKNEPEKKPTEVVAPAPAKPKAVAPAKPKAVAPAKVSAKAPAKRHEKSHPSAEVIVIRKGTKGNEQKLIRSDKLSATLKTEHGGGKVMVSASASKGWTKVAQVDLEHVVVAESFFEDDHLFVIVFEYDAEQNPVRTEGARYALKGDKLKTAGGFEGEGRVDYQTIEFDEH